MLAGDLNALKHRIPTHLPLPQHESLPAYCDRVALFCVQWCSWESVVGSSSGQSRVSAVVLGRVSFPVDNDIALSKYTRMVDDRDYCRDFLASSDFL